MDNDNSLLLIERMILESLEKSAKNLDSLYNDTHINHQLLINVLPHLLTRNLIHFKKGQYQINPGALRPIINNDENMQAEVRELIGSLINYYFKKNKEVSAKLHLRKVYLTNNEKNELDKKFKDIENFLFLIKETRRFKPQKETLHEREMFFWGRANYLDIVENFMQAI